MLLRVTEEHSITYSSVESISHSAQWLVERACKGVRYCLESKLNEHPEIDAASRECLFEGCQPGDLFEGLTSRYRRESYYEHNFHYVVRHIIMIYIIIVGSCFHVIGM